MEIITLTFKKLGNHWYLDIPHDNPADLMLDRRIEFMLSRLDTWKDGVVTNVSLICQHDFIDSEGLIQFDDADLLRYFTTNDDFIMALYINGHKWSISSRLYFLIEQRYKLDLHELMYKISIF